MFESVDWYTELKIFMKYFIESFLLLIVIQLVSDKINNNSISYIKEAKTALMISIVIYIAKCISQDASDNVRQGMHYSISAVFLSQYNV